MITTEKPVMNWLTQAETCALLQCTQWTLKRFVVGGMIRRRQIPGHRRYWREDVERLAAPPPAA